jgi:hypothetical protein
MLKMSLAMLKISGRFHHGLSRGMEAEVVVGI